MLVKISKFHLWKWTEHKVKDMNKSNNWMKIIQNLVWVSKDKMYLLSNKLKLLKDEKKRKIINGSPGNELNVGD